MIIGIVGKPNVGKSAFFRSLTLAEAESGNFPFTTIDPNSAVGYVKVRDPALDFDKHSNPRDGFVLGDWRFAPIEIIDVAGLVPGAHEGKGLGNKFLDDLRQADALIHVIDLSGGTNERGESVAVNSYDPANDVRFLEEEMDQWFFNVLKKNWINIEKKFRQQDLKIEEAIFSVVSGLNVSLDEIFAACASLSLDKSNVSDYVFELAQKLREVSKPMIIAANKCDLLVDDGLWKRKLDALVAEFPSYIIVPIIAEYEANLKTASKAGLLNYIPGEKSFSIVDEAKLSDVQKAGLSKIGSVLEVMGGTGVQRCLDSAVFDLLKLKPIFPGGSKLEDAKGNVLPDCFLMSGDATALDFAYRLHTDFGKNFIKAIDIKTKRMVGKEHVLKFGDIVEIVSGK